jgi:hypothetical protein
MTQLSTNLRVELAELKTLLMNIAGKKRGCTQRRNKDSEAASSCSGNQVGDQAMEVYDEIAHNMEISWDSMCESKREKDKTSHARITQGCITPGQGKPSGAY